MQLVCFYEAGAASGVVDAIHGDGETVDMALYPHCVLIPYPGDAKDAAAVARLGRAGPPPQPIGEAPKGTDPKTGKPWEDRRVTPPDDRPWAAPAITKGLLVGYAAAVRYRAEVAGITVDGIPVATDRDSQAAIERLASRAARDPTFAPPFKGSDGVVRTVTAAQLVAIGDAVSDHVQACRAAEADLAEKIAAGTVTGSAAVDAAFAGPRA